MLYKNYIFELKVCDHVVRLVKKENFLTIINAINAGVTGNKKVLELLVQHKQFHELLKYVDILQANNAVIIVLSQKEHPLIE